MPLRLFLLKLLNHTKENFTLIFVFKIFFNGCQVILKTSKLIIYFNNRVNIFSQFTSSLI